MDDGLHFLKADKLGFLKADHGWSGAGVGVGISRGNSSIFLKGIWQISISWFLIDIDLISKVLEILLDGSS